MIETYVVTTNEYLAWILEFSLSQFEFTFLNKHDSNFFREKAPNLLIYDLPTVHNQSGLHKILNTITCPVMFVDSSNRNVISNTIEALKLKENNKGSYQHRDNNNSYLLTKNLIFDIESHCLYKGDEKIHLSTIEFKLLYILTKNETPLSSEELIDYLDTTGPAVLYVYIRKLREKLEDNPCKPQVLVCSRGKGYYIKNFTK
ncbi:MULTISPECIES: response regulator transcription factor [Priestia]|uniref:OmpR/PhoB-type domain-containing protein n=1 Tax=Priestia megaterium TaxID=1404 RepID=A0A6M6E276_PRIMG|nr:MULTISPECIES: winged helix-turn-helix domain-containing protein [Priestia]MDC0705545.1 winged helix-turn-helix domain-containing protein [Priestia sp. AB]MDH3155987.1 winged helix-turn-helix domain-containing protein [Priestia megaterium]MED4116813.1 winged helix-turn-helix domain-containing protein [Priestia megaterium]QJX81183.1 hypothetical protein FDZ14_33505 [Priestia megaterium]